MLSRHATLLSFSPTPSSPKPSFSPFRRCFFIAAFATIAFEPLAAASPCHIIYFHAAFFAWFSPRHAIFSFRNITSAAVSCFIAAAAFHLLFAFADTPFSFSPASIRRRYFDATPLYCAILLSPFSSSFSYISSPLFRWLFFFAIFFAATFSIFSFASAAYFRHYFITPAISLYAFISPLFSPFSTLPAIFSADSFRLQAAAIIFTRFRQLIFSLSLRLAAGCFHFHCFAFSCWSPIQPFAFHCFHSRQLRRFHFRFRFYAISFISAIFIDDS